MSQFGDYTNLVLVKRLAGGLNLSERLTILSVALKNAIATSQEDYARELVSAIPQIISPDGLPKHAGDQEYFDAVAQSDREFCIALMEAYPRGSIRKKNSYDPKKSSLMGIRGDILRHLSLRWGQSFDDFGKTIFRFLLETLMPGEDDIALLPAEQEMILGVLRERLKHAGDFNERVTRVWLTEFIEFRRHNPPWHQWEDEFLQLLAIARVRNDLKQTVLKDIDLRNKNDGKKVSF